MAVIVKYVVVRDNVELEQTFTNKKEAEAYDNLLDAAQGLGALMKQGDLQIDVDPKTIDDISIYLAKNAMAVLQILKSVKPINPAPSDVNKPKSQTKPAEDKDKAPDARAKAKIKAA
ncbi:MAG: YebG family protein [Proteobacteria bacterium]|nr:YebG family protein [Pseudomonadota bacterium]